MAVIAATGLNDDLIEPFNPWPDTSGGPGVPPFIDDVQPGSLTPPGPPLGANQSVTIDLVGYTPFRRIVVAFKYPGLVFTEVVWVGATDAGGVPSGEFTERYFANSQVARIVRNVLGVDLNGLRFTLLRDPVWPDAPQLSIYAVQTDGLEL